MRYIFAAIALTASLSPAFADEGTSKPAAVDPDQAIKCRKIEVTGSLVKKGKVCKTVAEWRAIADNNNYLARKMVEDGTTRPSGE